ncbi:TANK-binding kinase 1-binding protein 1 isoform X3 [Monodelphis domestica]|uniref:TANK-binding kinase 1-binding protein 1 isoform X3 n=1 Tax=Monodelphis domestica TaxID=13616 RepID=UPI0024E1F6C5|nr:TANK-binding kinase 1-binding protein 1 isoform X3 [Monodelphis domestica]
MESMFEDDISILTQEALGSGEVWLDGPGGPVLGSDMCSASHFALITAYGDIKERLGGLERENATLRRRLKVYEIKYPVIGDFGDEHSFSLYEIKEGSLLEVEKSSLQQRLNQFQHELQKNKEQEEQLGEMIQAYEKLCVEKSDLENELGEMRALVETHLRQICGLQQQLRQHQGGGDSSFPCLSPPSAPAPPDPDLDLHYLALRGGPGLGHVLEPSLGWPSPPSVGELERRRLEEALEAARGEARGAQLREEQLQAECERLQGELKQLQESRAQDLASNQSERDMAWVKRVGDDQVNLALAYTELTEELGRLRELSSLQGRILRTLLQEQAQRSAPQPRPPPGERTLVELAYAKPPSHHVKAGFQGRRSYSEMADGAGYAGAVPWLQAEASTLPKPRPYGGELYSPSQPLSPRSTFEGIRLRFEKQSSEEEEWAVPSPPSPEAGTIRCASFCAGFPIPETPTAAYTHAEHAQSWPSINLLMETVGSDIRSCPLCQLGFPVGYPDDALIKHIDSHLENSKI